MQEQACSHETTREEDTRKHLKNTKLTVFGCGVLGHVICVDQRGSTENLGFVFIALDNSIWHKVGA